MSNKTKILSELSKIIVESMSSFSDIKKEIETIVSLRVNKVLNKMNLVKRDEFEVLKKMVQKLIIDKEIAKKTKKTSKTRQKKTNTRKKKKKN